MHILEERIAKHLIVLGGTDDCRDPLQSRRSGRADPSLPHDDLVSLAIGTDHDRLQNADRFNAGRQILQWLLVERSPRLTRVGIDPIKRKLLEDWSRRRLGPLFN
jgi:hypothetical protein